VGLLSNPHKIACLPLTTPRPLASQDSPSRLLPEHSISQNVKTAGDAESSPSVPHRPQMSPLTAWWSGVRLVFVFWEVVPRNRRKSGFIKVARKERTTWQLLLYGVSLVMVACLQRDSLDTAEEEEDREPLHLHLLFSEAFSSLSSMPFCLPLCLN